MEYNKKWTWAAIIVAIVSIAMIFGFAGSAGAAAKRLFGGEDIRNNSVTTRDIQNDSLTLKDAGPVLRNEILNNEGPQGPRGFNGQRGFQGEPGVDGEDGAPGHNGMLGAYFAQAVYNVGDTNQGAIATVACQLESDVALSGGVQMIGVGGKNAAVGSSFPGRMDWNTNTPKAGRLDGWIVQFDASVAPEKVTVWALCLPEGNIPVVNTYFQS